MFQSLISLPKQAVFVLINEKDKKVYVSYSTKLHFKLGDMAFQMHDGSWRWKDMQRDKKKLQLIILETTAQKHFVKYYREYYRNKGYQLYNEKERIPLYYTFHIKYTARKAIVVAMNRNQEQTVLGRFDTYEEARGFLFYIRYNNPANSLCYSINGSRF